MRVSQSLAKLDLHTLIMRSTARHADEAGSSLDGSTYEFLGDSLLETSDDEAQTESIASTEGPTPDDASDFSDDGHDYPMGDRDLQDSLYSSQAENTPSHMDVFSIGSGDGSTLTERAAGMDRSGSMWIRLNEQPVEDSSITYGSDIFISKPDANSELHKVLEVYGCAQVRMLVKAALAPDYAPTPDTYRILYIGKPEKWIEDLITEHIGKALTASPNVSKSVMVRGQIEPYSPVMHRLRCDELFTFAEYEKSSHVLMILDDGHEMKFGHGIRSAPGDQPDLVVFCHPASPGGPDTSAFAAASHVFQSERIACIELTTARPYGTGITAFDPTRLRVHVEGCNDGEYELKEVLPLDYYTFIHLDPSQLNRHLALISPHLVSATHARNNAIPFAKAKDSEGWSATVLDELGPLFQVLIKAMTVLVLVPALILGIYYTPTVYQISSGSSSRVSILPQHASVISTSIDTVCTSTSPSVASLSATSHVPHQLVEVPSAPRVAKRPEARPEHKEKEHGFQIQGLGDHQFVLTSQGRPKASKNKPQIQIEVFRESQSVAVRYNRTVNGDYVVDLESEYPKSSFNVSIVTHSRPLLRQSFEITLGHNQSTLDQLVGTARRNLLRLSSATVQHMRSRISRYESISVPSKHMTAYLQNTQQVVQHGVSTGTELLKQVHGAAWTGLRQGTAPVRTSRMVKNARRNALRIRCKVETAMGPATKGVDYAEKGACAKVRDRAERAGASGA